MQSADLLSVRTQALCTHNRFHAEIYGLEYSLLPLSLLCGGAHTQDDLCVRSYATDNGEH